MSDREPWLDHQLGCGYPSVFRASLRVAGGLRFPAYFCTYCEETMSDMNPLGELLFRLFNTCWLWSGSTIIHGEGCDGDRGLFERLMS